MDLHVFYRYVHESLPEHTSALLHQQLEHEPQSDLHAQQQQQQQQHSLQSNSANNQSSYSSPRSLPRPSPIPASQSQQPLQSIQPRSILDEELHQLFHSVTLDDEHDGLSLRRASPLTIAAHSVSNNAISIDTDLTFRFAVTSATVSSTPNTTVSSQTSVLPRPSSQFDLSVTPDISRNQSPRTIIDEETKQPNNNVQSEQKLSSPSNKQSIEDKTLTTTLEATETLSTKTLIQHAAQNRVSQLPTVGKH